mmetsp:Transcript_28637/g.45487  ORF Transcript_28637/g.45487 Transcript_28637/m.45487 type:complete len:250 (+) Transcript_28637:782-1531(+)
MNCVSRHVSTFVICVDHEIQSCGLFEQRVTRCSKHVRIVSCPIKVWVVGWPSSIFKRTMIDPCCNDWDSGNNVERILQCILPVFVLLHSGIVGCLEFRSLLKCKDRHGNLRHRVHIFGQFIHDVQGELRNGSPLMELCSEGFAIGVRRYLTRQEQPKRSFWKTNITTWCFRKFLVALVQRLTSVSNTDVCIQVRCVCDHGFDRPRTIDAHLHSQILDLSVSCLLQKFCLQCKFLFNERLHLRYQLFDYG